MRKKVIDYQPFTLRDVSLSDLPRILEITARVWKGYDQNEALFRSWIEDPNGWMTGAWIDDYLVGFAHLKFLTPRDAWLEGLKKDPEAPVKGVGESFTRHFFDRLAKIPNLRSIRFATYFRNDESIHINTRLGFRPIYHWSMKSCCLGRFRKIPTPCTADWEQNPGPEWIDRIANTDFVRAMDGNVTYGWTVYPCDEVFIHKALNRGALFHVTTEGAIRGLALVTVPERDGHTWISVIRGDNDDTRAALINKIAWWSRKFRHGKMGVLLPDTEEKQFMEAHGFRGWESDHDFIVFDYPVNSLPKAKE